MILRTVKVTFWSPEIFEGDLGLPESFLAHLLPEKVSGDFVRVKKLAIKVKLRDRAQNVAFENSTI